MTITKDNYKDLKPQVEGKRLDELELDETYTALCYLTHRVKDEPIKDQWWTMNQIRMVRTRQRELLAERGIYVLRG